MAQQGQAAGTAQAGAGTHTPMIVIGILAAILNGAITLASINGYFIFIPINIIGGFAFNITPLFPASTAIILGFGLWRYSGTRPFPVIIAALCIFFLPILFVNLWNAFNGFLINQLPDSVVTNPNSFYVTYIPKSLLSVIGILPVLAVCSRQFRNWSVWIWLIVIWVGLDALVYSGFRFGTIPRNIYPWVYTVVRVLGLLVLGWYFGRPVQAARAPA
jgi:hypothetical protein